MTKRQKRLDRMRQNPKNVSFDELRIVLEDFGFEFVRSNGSHHSFNVVINGEPRLFVVPYKHPIKAVYVREALDLIDKIQEEQAQDTEGDEND